MKPPEREALIEQLFGHLRSQLESRISVTTSGTAVPIDLELVESLFCSLSGEMKKHDSARNLLVPLLRVRRLRCFDVAGHRSRPSAL